MAWMRSQMSERIGGNGSAPTWMIVRPNYSLRRMCDWQCVLAGEDFCGGMHVTPGKVWLSIRVPSDRVLTSDFDRWNAVLATGYVGSSEADCEAWARRVDLEAVEASGRLASWPASLRTEAEQTWDRVFDTKAATTVQGALWQIEPNDLVAAIDGPDPEAVRTRFPMSMDTYGR